MAERNPMTETGSTTGRVAVADSHNPPPGYEAPIVCDGIIDTRDVMVPMRDGKHLCVDIYRPNIDGKFPALFPGILPPFFLLQQANRHRRGGNRATIKIMQLAILAMRLLEVMFFVGLAGSAVVVLISFFEDGKELFGKD